jgi:pimeloyl-ACP methyl ester carboxylesterase
LRGHDNPQRAREALELYWPMYAQRGGAEGLARQVRSLRIADTRAVGDRIPGPQVPARVVSGAADRLQKGDYGEGLAWDLGADLDRIKEGKHCIPEDHPDAIAARLKGLLAAVS